MNTNPPCGLCDQPVDDYHDEIDGVAYHGRRYNQPNDGNETCYLQAARRLIPFVGASSVYGDIDTSEWAKDLERPGLLKHVRTKTVDEVFAELRAKVGELGPGHNDYFSVAALVPAHQPWPSGRTVVFPVAGGSEGHYVHVEVIDQTRTSHLLMLAKTFDGFEAAWAFAQRVAAHLGA